MKEGLLRREYQSAFGRSVFSASSCVGGMFASLAIQSTHADLPTKTPSSIKSPRPYFVFICTTKSKVPCQLASSTLISRMQWFQFKSPSIASYPSSLISPFPFTQRSSSALPKYCPFIGESSSAMALQCPSSRPKFSSRIEQQSGLGKWVYASKKERSVVGVRRLGSPLVRTSLRA